MDIEYIDPREYNKCKSDPVYFIFKYIYSMNMDMGMQILSRREYLVDYINHIHGKHTSMTIKARQLGFTTVSLAYVLWYSLFHSGKKVFIGAWNHDASREQLKIITEMIRWLPELMQPTLVQNNLSLIKFNNDTIIKSVPVNCCATRGYSIDLVYLDEVAWGSGHNLDSFIANSYPIISSTKGKIIITATNNPKNKEFNIIKDDLIDKGYVKVYPWYVDDSRDIEFITNQIRLLGYEKVNIEYIVE